MTCMQQLLHMYWTLHISLTPQKYQQGLEEFCPSSSVLCILFLDISCLVLCRILSLHIYIVIPAYKKKVLGIFCFLLKNF